MSQFDDWLNSLSSQGLRKDLPPLMIGTNYTLEWLVTEHELLGNFEGGTWLAEVKAALGTDADVVATITVTSGTFASGVNPISINLPIAAQTGFTEPAPTPGITYLPFTMLYTPLGGTAALARAGLLPVLAGVSA